MSSTFRVGALIRGLVGAAVGVLVGYFGFSWILGQGFYAMILPGAAVGLGFGLLSGVRCKGYGILCAVLGVALGLFLEWQFFPFREDDSLGFFLTHVHELKPISLVMIGLGGLFAFWFGTGRDRRASR